MPPPGTPTVSFPHTPVPALPGHLIWRHSAASSIGSLVLHAYMFIHVLFAYALYIFIYITFAYSNYLCCCQYLFCGTVHVRQGCACAEFSVGQRGKSFVLMMYY